MDKKQYIEAGRIVNTHGVRGEVKIEVWLDSAEFLRSFKRVFIGEREIKIESAFVHKGFLIAKLEGVDDVNAAMTFKGREISILRADAKLPKGAFFISDIIGASVVTEDGAETDLDLGHYERFIDEDLNKLSSRARRSTLFRQYLNLLCQPMLRTESSPSGS